MVICTTNIRLFGTQIKYFVVQMFVVKRNGEILENLVLDKSDVFTWYSITILKTPVTL